MLLFVLNMIFSVSTCLLVAFLAARSFLASGSPSVLLMGSGMLLFGLASGLAGVSIGRERFDTGVIVYNTGAALAGTCNLVAGLNLIQRVSGSKIRRPQRLLFVVYGAALVLLSIDFLTARIEWLPSFFDPAQGPTNIRQLVLMAGILQFALAAWLLRKTAIKNTSSFLHWYWQGLALIAIGLLGVWNIEHLNSLDVWVGRAIQYLGGLYMLMAAIMAIRESRQWMIPLEILEETHQRYINLVEHSPDAILIHTSGRYVFANPAAAELFGAVSPQDLIGQVVMDLVHPDDRQLVAGRIHSFTDGAKAAPLAEMKILRLDGQAVDVEAVDVAAEHMGQPAVQVVFRDITERQLAQQQLKELNATLERRVTERTAELQKRTDQLRSLTSQLTQAEQKERQRIATILHDHLQQLLVGAKFNLSVLRQQLKSPESAEWLEQVDSLLDESLETSRNLTVDLSPPILQVGSMRQVFQWLSEWIRNKHGLVVIVRADDDAHPPEHEVRVLLFQVMRELLFNVVKHAGVNQACVDLSLTDQGQIRAVVSDAGCGFDQSSPPLRAPAGSGFGLFAVRERVEWLGGMLQIDSQPGKGTRTTVLLPMQIQTEQNKSDPAG